MDLILIIVVLVVLATGAAVSLARNFHEHRSIEHYSSAMGRLRDLGRQPGTDQHRVDQDSADQPRMDDHRLDQADGHRILVGGRGTPGPPPIGPWAPDRLVSAPPAPAGLPLADENRGHLVLGTPDTRPPGDLPLARVDVPYRAVGPPGLDRSGPADGRPGTHPPAEHGHRARGRHRRRRWGPGPRSTPG